MGLYSHSKQYFTSLSNRGVEEATEALTIYSDLKEAGQDFSAAKFLVDVYEDFTESMTRMNAD